MSLSYLPYCYVIGWTQLGVWYYGSEFGERTKTANPRNLWRTYFTSSDIVCEFVRQHGDPDVIQVRRTFCTAQATIEWEYKVLRRLHVRAASNWLNVNDGKAPKGTPWSLERKTARSASMSGASNPNYGKTTPPHVRHKISESHRGRHGGENNHMYGTRHTAAARRKMKDNHPQLSGPNNPNYGNHWSNQKRQQSSDSRHPSFFTFTHATHGTITSTVHAMVSSFPELKKGGLRALYQGRLLQYKGWSFIAETTENV